MLPSADDAHGEEAAVAVEGQFGTHLAVAAVVVGGEALASACRST